LRHLRSLFLLFEAASGLKVNLAKSNLIHMRNVDQVERLADIIECGIASLPVKYLGLPISPLIFGTRLLRFEKIEHRLTSWQRLYLSKGGRVTLIKSTLANMLTYFFSMFPILGSVTTRLEKL